MRKLRQVFDQAAMEQSWSGLNRFGRIVSILVLTLLPIAALFALGVMGPRLAREGSLLWFGSTANGTLRSINLADVGKFKDGAPKYRLTLDFTFPTPDGRRFAGTTVRTDIRYLPTLKAGDPIGVYYAKSDPQRSVAEYNLRTDVYALLLFLPFLTVIGLGLPLIYLLMFARARRARLVREKPTHWVRKPR